MFKKGDICVWAHNDAKHCIIEIAEDSVENSSFVLAWYVTQLTDNAESYKFMKCIFYGFYIKKLC